MNDEVTITMPLAAWKLIADSSPTNQETYTPEGIAIFNAWQPILQALKKEDK